MDGGTGTGSTEDKLAVVTLREYILHGEELCRLPDRGLHQNQNPIFFRADFLEGKLERYEGTWVAYQKGILCGQSADGKKLRHEATCHYGGSGLTVFPVPATKGATIDDINAKIDEAVEKALQ